MMGFSMEPIRRLAFMKTASGNWRSPLEPSACQNMLLLCVNVLTWPWPVSEVGIAFCRGERKERKKEKKSLNLSYFTAPSPFVYVHKVVGPLSIVWDSGMRVHLFLFYSWAWAPLSPLPDLFFCLYFFKSRFLFVCYLNTHSKIHSFSSSHLPPISSHPTPLPPRT